MDDIVLTKTLRSQGFDDRDLGRLRRDGSLVPVRRGAYVRERPAKRTVADGHRELIFATAPQLHDGAVISHASAAVLHRLPIWPKAIDRVHVTRNRSSGGNRRSIVQVHTAPLADDHTTVVDGLPVTSLARTVLDLCRTVPIEQAVAADAGAAARHLRRAREVCRPRRLLLEQRTIGEFDGKIKYGRQRKPGQSLEEAIFAEKLREDALRDLGWQIVRWLWADLYRPGVIRDRVLRAFARSSS